MRHEARQVPAWLIFDVRRMKIPLPRNYTVWQFCLLGISFASLVAMLFLGADVIVRKHYLHDWPVWPDYVAITAVFVAFYASLREAITLRFYRKRMPADFHPRKNA